MDASTTTDLMPGTASSGTDGCGPMSESAATRPYWTVAHTLSTCGNCGKQVPAGARLLRFSRTGAEYCYRAHCAELQWLVYTEAEDEAREREEWARRHTATQALALPVE